jgi:hypothetical protein
VKPCIEIPCPEWEEHRLGACAVLDPFTGQWLWAVDAVEVRRLPADDPRLGTSRLPAPPPARSIWDAP